MRHRSGVELDLSLGALPFEREAIERAERVDVEGINSRSLDLSVRATKV